MTVLEEADAFSGPNHNVSVCATRGPALSVLRVGQTVDNIAMSALRVDHLSGMRIIDHNTVTDRYQDLLAV